MAFAALLVLNSCDRTTNPTGLNKRSVAPVAAVMTPAVIDPTMGSLSPLARHIVIALRDSATRVALIQAMKSAQPRGLGLDLSTCAEPGTAQALIRMGEVNGGSAAVSMCSLISKRRGVTLYMSAPALAAWDASVIPVVTAIDNPNLKMSHAFVGYRSPTRTIVLSDTGHSVSGPVLVILPIPHPARVARNGRSSISTQFSVFHVDTASRTSQSRSH
jgi:hypothetical protein